MLNERLLISLAFGLPIAPLHPLPFDPYLFADFDPRDYQDEILWEIADLIQQGYTRILVQLATGGGKTVIASALLGALNDGTFGDFHVHRKELIEQTSKTFLRQSIEHSFVAAKKPFDPAAQVLLAGVQTLVRRLGKVRAPNIVIVDEAHHCVAGTWQTILNSFPPDTIIIGLSATPERLDGKGLGDQFQVMVQGPPVAWLIEQGYLSPFDYYGPDEPDLASVRTLGGDWAKDGLQEACDRPKLIGNIVEHYLTLAKGKQGIGFAVSCEHSRKIVEAFVGEGVRAAHIDGAMDSDERERLDAMYRAGDLDLLSQVDLFGEGYDVPGAVYCGQWCPSKSRAKVMQQGGRVLRVIYADGFNLNTMTGRLAAITAGPKSHAIIADHAGNWKRHLFPDSPYEWSLKGRASASRATGCNSDAPPIHSCMNCYRVTFSTVTVCPGCGTEFPRQQRDLKHEAGTLSKLEREELRKKQAADRKAEVRACTSYEELYNLAVDREYEFPKQWARRQAMFMRVPERTNITAEMFD